MSLAQAHRRPEYQITDRIQFIMSDHAQVNTFNSIRLDRKVALGCPVDDIAGSKKAV